RCLPFLVHTVSFSHAPPTTAICTLSLHDALPIFGHIEEWLRSLALARPDVELRVTHNGRASRRYRGGGDGLDFDEGAGRLLETRSEEHTSELQSRENLVCRLLLEKKKNEIQNG